MLLYQDRYYHHNPEDASPWTWSPPLFLSSLSLSLCC